MAQVIKGKCKDRKHTMVWKKDGDGRPFFSCEVCGIAPVNMEKRNGTTKNV